MTTFRVKNKKGIIIETFASITSNEILKAIEEEGYENPTAIQKRAIPIVLKNKDLIAAAKSGTGKTATFLLPILQNLQESKKSNSFNILRALIVVPTRELANQIAKNGQNYAKYLPNIKIATAVGGLSTKAQADKFERGVDIVVATPGRLKEHIENKSINLSSVQTLVLDEADTMLDMGFLTDLEAIFPQTSPNKQIMMFTATLSQNIKKLAKEFLVDPEVIEVTTQRERVHLIEHVIYKVDRERKTEMLSYLIGSQNLSPVLVFVNNKKMADIITEHFNLDGLPTACMHGDVKQSARRKALEDFKKGKLRVLVATDIAARGIDIEDLPYVVNYSLPEDTDSFTHRVGRTGRAGNRGNAISLICTKEYTQMYEIEKDLMLTIPRKELEGFELTEKEPRYRKKKALPIKEKKSAKPKREPKKASSKKTTKRDSNRNFRR